jgi:hypothetical protein
MHADNSRPDDLSGLERQLAGWRPAGDGLDADAMLFAAGRASARPRGRLLWPALACGLGVLAVALGAWAAAERAERLTLAETLRQHPAPAPPAVLPGPSPDAPSDGEGTRHGPLALRNLVLEHGLDAWRDESLVHAGPPGPPAPDTPVLRPWQRDRLADP